MALSVDLSETVFGLPLEDTYMRITRFSGNKTIIQLELTFFASLEAAQSGALPVRQSHVNIPYVEGGLPAFYSAVLAMDEFSSAKNC